MAIQNESYVELEIKLEKHIKVRSKCSNEEKSIITHIYHEFLKAISYTYDDLKTYDKSVIQHTVELELDAKPYRQKQRLVNLKIEEAIKQEFIKLLDSRIIYPIKHSSWVVNVVLVRKKSGEIRLCVDFRNLNQVSLKYNYPLSLMEQILHIVARA